MGPLHEKPVLREEDHLFRNDGSLELTSEVYGDDDHPDSEKHYVFSKEQTDKLFSMISLEDLIESCQRGRLFWLEAFLRRNGIRPREWVY